MRTGGTSKGTWMSSDASTGTTSMLLSLDKVSEFLLSLGTITLLFTLFFYDELAVIYGPVKLGSVVLMAPLASGSHLDTSLAVFRGNLSPLELQL